VAWAGFVSGSRPALVPGPARRSGRIAAPCQAGAHDGAVRALGGRQVVSAASGLFPLLRQDDMLPIYIRLDHTLRNVPLRTQVFDAIGGRARRRGCRFPRRGATPRCGSTFTTSDRVLGAAATARAAGAGVRSVRGDLHSGVGRSAGARVGIVFGRNRRSGGRVPAVVGDTALGQRSGRARRVHRRRPVQADDVTAGGLPAGVQRPAPPHRRCGAETVPSAPDERRGRAGGGQPGQDCG